MDSLAAYHEVQPLRAVWQWVLVAFVAVVFCWLGTTVLLRTAGAAGVASGGGTGVRRGLGAVLVALGLALCFLPWSQWARVSGTALLLFGVLLPVLAWHFRLQTDVRPDGIRIRLVPFVDRFIPLTEVEQAEARQYHPIREYGGWGVRCGAAGTAYNMRGDRGVQLVLKNGERVLIGSQTPEALARAIDAARRKP